MDAPRDPFDRWLAALERRHLADLTFAEVRRALQAVSTSYVERRDRLRRASSIFDGAGKRAAFAMVYGPLHFLVARHVVAETGLDKAPLREIVDLGCGTGVASAAWAAACPRPPAIHGVDRNAWALGEARQTWHELGLHGRTARGDATEIDLPGSGGGIVAGWMVNELGDRERDALLAACGGAAERGARVLVIEPIAKRVSPWWDGWARAFEGFGGSTDTWRFRVDLPPLLERFDRAAGLNHRELKARTLVV